MARPLEKVEITTSQTVESCYDILDLAVATGVRDFTEGIYHGDPATPYEEAQQHQADHLLDLAACHHGSRLLDIGCGYGRVLETARQRGASAIGITISSEQVSSCQAEGLDVRLLDYRQCPSTWSGQFDCVIANGSLEHFVQPEDAAKGRADHVYREMFGIVHRLLDPSSDSGRFVTTAIHFDRVQIDPQEMLRSPRYFRRGSANHHYALLLHAFGGFYPSAGQLQRCASGLFELIAEEDGTLDYHLTAERWLQLLKRALFRNPRFVLGVAGQLWKRPRQSMTLLDCLLIAQSWNWQFRGTTPPMKLRRHTWRRIVPGDVDSEESSYSPVHELPRC